jgi:hypothetical protein
LRGFFAKRLQALLDAWSMPAPARAATAPAREFLAGVVLPRLWSEAYGGEALARAEKDLPPPRPPAPIKAGAQVKSLAALGQAVRTGGGTNAWAGAALVLGAGFVSRECFSAWFRCFAQPPVEARAAFSELLAEASAFPDWEARLASPFIAARLASAWLARVPGCPASASAESPAGEDIRREAEEAGSRTEAVRKGAKAWRDGVCARLSALGRSVGGLPKEERAALDAQDQNLPWQRKLAARIILEAALARMGAKAPPAKAAEPKAVEAEQARRERDLKDLARQFRKL